MNRFTLRQSMILFTAALIWGFAFVAQSVGMDYVGPYTFIAARNIVALVILVPCAIITDLKNKENNNHKNNNKILIKGGICCGTCLFAASTLQQIGIKYTTVGKAGFVTAMYIVLVPLFGFFMKKRTGIRVWTAVMIASIGMYFLCIAKGGFKLQKGDIYMLSCAVVFAFQILSVDYFSPMVNGVKLSCMQTLTNAVLGIAMMLLFERPSMEHIKMALLPILYAGALSSGVGYTFQIIGQKGINPTIASLIMSLESVISVIAGWILLDQTLTKRETAGCILAFGAIILVQLPEHGLMSGKNAGHTDNKADLLK